MNASQALVELAGGAFEGSLNWYDRPVSGMVVTVQLDEVVFVVGPEDFTVRRYTLGGWLNRDAADMDPQAIKADDAAQAWELLRLIREDCLLWQCGGCDAWIFTTDRPRIGVLECSTCGDGGVDFRHADRHVGEHW